MADLMDLTPAELRIAQRKAGLDSGILGVLESPADPGWLDAVTALAWVVRKRDEPDVTMEAVADTPVSQLTQVLGLAGDDEEGAPAPGRG